MPEPVVFISHFEIKPGSLDGYRAMLNDAVPQLEHDKPDTLAFLPYVDEDGGRLTVVHVFGDVAAMDRHFEGAGERSRAAYDYLVPSGWEVYGPASEGALETLRRGAEAAGVDLTTQPEYLGGFLRLR